MFKLSEYEVGLAAPPFHPWCRCCTCPYFADVEGLAERWTRNADGDTEKVPADMGFEEWKGKFVSDGKSELTLPVGIDKIKDNQEPAHKPLTIEQVKQVMTEQVENLAEEHRQALQNYTGFSATRINSAIRHGKITPEIQKEIDILDAALKDGVMPETVVLHRDTVLSFLGLGLPDEPTAEDFSRIAGRPITNRIFTSTSFTNLGLAGRNAELWLTVPAGYRGCQYLPSVAFPKYKHQEEVLFARGMQYKITDAKIENGKYVLFAEVFQ